MKREKKWSTGSVAAAMNSGGSIERPRLESDWYN
jgi:hypothetical protein